jgi:threonine/homoserine/homoserine lactone efflux protein
MNSTLSLDSMAALFTSMLILAAIPSVSVMTVTARSATAGFTHGAMTSAGIVVGDIIFILLAILGLTFLAEMLGDWFTLVKYLGGAYLIWSGMKYLLSTAISEARANHADASPLSSFLAGLFITLGDQKAVLFYLSFFPAFMDLTALTMIDAGLIILITVVAVGGVKLGYACIGGRAGMPVSGGAFRVVNRIAGMMLIAIGLYLFIMA